VHRWSARRVAMTVLVAGLHWACVDRLPDQDLRIRSAVPAAKLSADLLWREFQDNADTARRTYWGTVVEITGTVTTVGDNVPGQRFVLFGQGNDNRGVRANLLDDTAGTILSAMPESRRLTLRCYCEGLAGDLILKSCIAP
jgi:hypothetical protein